MDVRMFVNSNVRNAYIWVLPAIIKKKRRNYADLQYINRRNNKSSTN